MDRVPASEAELDELLSRPTPEDIEAAGTLEGDLLILGASGKMGPSLARLARRAADQAGVRRHIWAAARFRTPGVRETIERAGVSTIACDLLDPPAVAALPEAPNVILMAGQKFGTAEDRPGTWATNVLAPALAAERFRHARLVAFSTGNVYPLWPLNRPGPTEAAPTLPVGEYAMSALGRERVLEHASRRHQTAIAILRLNYAVELRYGVVRDLADRILHGEPVDLSMGYVNVIWQRDANAVALRAFAHAGAPPWVLNVTGRSRLAVRDLARVLGNRLGREPRFESAEGATALLSDASRCHELFDGDSVPVERIVEWTADWVAAGGRSLDRPTHYQEREGRF